MSELRNKHSGFTKGEVSFLEDSLMVAKFLCIKNKN